MSIAGTGPHGWMDALVNDQAREKDDRKGPIQPKPQFDGSMPEHEACDTRITRTRHSPKVVSVKIKRAPLRTCHVVRGSHVEGSFLLRLVS